MGRTLLGRGLAFSGSHGCCGFAHDNQRLERSGGVRAARRALLLPHQGALRSHKGGGIQALRVYRDIESLCFDRVCI